MASRNEFVPSDNRSQKSPEIRREIRSDPPNPPTPPGQKAAANHKQPPRETGRYSNSFKVVWIQQSVKAYLLFAIDDFTRICRCFAVIARDDTQDNLVVK